jgi:hypothetical protein
MLRGSSKCIEDLTNRSSQPLAVPMTSFHMTSTLTAQQSSLPPAVAELRLVRSMRRATLFAAATILALSSCNKVTKRYATLDDARRDRLFERGWLPDILPSSAHDIRVTSDLDVNRSEGEFSFDPAQFTSFVAQLRPAGDSFEYSAARSTWTFSCDSAHGHCGFSMR